jgi:hypothetical protein
MGYLALFALLAWISPRFVLALLWRRPVERGR